MTAVEFPSMPVGAPVLPENARLMRREYGNAWGWENGLFHNRTEIVRVLGEPREAGPHGGTVLRTTSWLESSDSLDGTAATVGTYERTAGAFVRVPSRAVNVAITAELYVLTPSASSVRMVANGVTVAMVEDVAGRAATVTASVALVQRDCDVLFAVEAEGACAVELMSIDIRELEPEDGVPVPASPTAYIVADSLAQTYADPARPQAGWGEWLAWYLGHRGTRSERDERFSYASATRYVVQDDVKVVNAAMAGRSARSFLVEGKLAQVVRLLTPGDMLIIQFGANDATCARPLRYATPKEFGDLLMCYVVSARDRGAVPVVVTPPPRYHFLPDGREVLDFEAYADIERELCKREGVALVDLSRDGAKMLEELGPIRSRALYLKLSAGKSQNYPNGIDDSTHLSELGARLFGRMVARGVAEAASGIAFADDVVGGAPIVPGESELLAEVDGPVPSADSIAGFDVYEVDEAGLIDRIGFSVRFCARGDIERYRVVARNGRSGASLVLGTIDASEVDGLHSYSVNREPGWMVAVEGDAPGGLCRSDACSLPYVAEPTDGRASWEVPF